MGLENETRLKRAVASISRWRQLPFFVFFAGVLFSYVACLRNIKPIDIGLDIDHIVTPIGSVGLIKTLSNKVEKKVFIE